MARAHATGDGPPRGRDTGTAHRAAWRSGRGAVAGQATVPAALAVAAAWGWRVLVVGVVVYLVITFLAGIPVVSVPIVLAILLVALLHPPTRQLRRFLPDWLAALVVLILAIAVIGGIGYFVAFQVQHNAVALGQQAQHLLSEVHRLVTDLPGVSGGSNALLDKTEKWVTSNTATLLSGAVAASAAIAEIVTGAVLTLFLTLFFLIDGRRQWEWLIRLLPSSAGPVVNGAGQRAFTVLSGWIHGTAIIALIHAVVIGGTLWLLGAPLAIVLAVLVFIGSFIPILGAFVFGGLSVLVTLVTVGVWPALILLGVLVVESLLEAHVYQPLIMGHTVGLHPVVILLALAVGAVLAGIMGAIAAIPVAAAVSAAVKYLTGIEDIDGHPVTDRVRRSVTPPAVVRRPGRRHGR